jgi:hypothetical protein
MKHPLELFACVIRQYGTGLYRACVRVERDRLVYLGSYQNESKAHETMSRFLEAQQSGEVRTVDDLAGFVAGLQVA